MRLSVRTRTEPRQPPDGEPGPDAVKSGGHDPGAGDPSGVAHPVAPAVVPRWVQMVMLPLGLLALYALAKAAGTILLVLIVAAVVALMLAPIVRTLERWIPRGLAIAIVYLGFFLFVAAVGVLLASPIASQITTFEHNLPSITRDANRQLANFQVWLNSHGINIHIQHQGQTALDTIQKYVSKRSSTIVSFSRDILSTIVTVSFDLVLILVLSIYLLLYGKQIGELVRRIMPPGDGTPSDDYPLLVQHAVSGYVRGQLLFSLIMGASAAICLTILGLVGIFPAGKTYGAFFGAFYGLMEFIPYIGPIIGPIPAILVGLFQNPISAVWLLLLFVALQQLEGHVVAPQVFGISLRINPILIILSLLIGFKIYGIVGALVALPVAAVIRQTVVYLRRHLVLEPWGTQGPGLGLMGPAATGPPGPPGPPGPGARGAPGARGEPAPEPEHCPECGAPVGPADAFCRACGASLSSEVGARR
jgi:predicted PurR-regulated permease PerM